MPITMSPGVALTGPTKQKTPLDALAEFLSAQQGVPDNQSPIVPGGLPAPNRTEYDRGDGTTGSFTGLSRGTLESPYEQDQTAQAHAADVKDAETTKQHQILADFFNPEAEQQRAALQGDKVALAEAPGKVAGQSARDVATITGNAGIERQRVANEGQIGAAEATARGKAGTGGRLPSGLMERVAGAHSALQTLDELEPLVKDPSFLGGIGPAAGRVNEFLQGVPGAPSNDNFNKVAARSATLANATIKAITGAQMSEAEAVRIMQQIPTHKDRPDVWQAKATAMRSNLQNTIANIQNENVGGGQGLSRERLIQIAGSLGLNVGGDMSGDPSAYQIEIQ